ncbi:hypothetical protein A2U01_0036874, partial [Trifolium medium]|nr:hypothetical protein [Trifolium medium]
MYYPLFTLMSSFYEDVGGSELPRRCWAEVSSRLYVSKLSSYICVFPVLAGLSYDDGDPSLE